MSVRVPGVEQEIINLATFHDDQTVVVAFATLLYAANSFAFERSGESHLVMPEGVSQKLRDQVRAQGARVVTIDVSEFLKKGGGSVKCMIGDLGML